MACTKVAGCWQFDPSTAFCLHVYPLFTFILRRCIEFSREPATAWPEQIQQNVVHRRVVASVAAPAVFSRKSKLVLRILSCGSVRIVYQYSTPESRAAKPLKIQVCFFCHLHYHIFILTYFKTTSSLLWFTRWRRPRPELRPTASLLLPLSRAILLSHAARSQQSGACIPSISIKLIQQTNQTFLQDSNFR